MKSSTMGVRPAHLGDIQAITELESTVFGADAYSEQTFQKLMRERCIDYRPPGKRGGGTDTVATSCQSPSNCCAIFTVESSGSIIGYSIAQIRSWPRFLTDYGIDPQDVSGLGLGDSSRIGYLKSIAVHPDHRREGIGRLLHAAREPFLRGHQVRHAFLLQMPTPGLADFHRSLGFTELPATPSLQYTSGGRARLWCRTVS